MSTLFLQIQTGADAVLAEEPTEKTMTILELMTSGGIGGILIMTFLGVLSVFAVYIFLERFGAIRSANKVDPNFMNNIKDMVLDGKLDAAGALCKAESTPVARMIEKGISRIGKPLGDITQAIENQGKLEVTRLEKGLPMLATISGGAPMIGFLGTVTGMIQAFISIAEEEGAVSPKLLSSGIYEAMLTTAAGLFVGIIAYLSYNYLVSRVEKLIHKMEYTTIEFIETLQSKK